MTTDTKIGAPGDGAPDTAIIQPPPPARTPKRKSLWAWVIALALVALIGVIGIWFLTQRTAPPKYGVLVNAPEPAGNFTLSGSTGEPVSLSDFRGKTVLLYFGYTTCPDVCPTTLADLKNTMTTLGDKAKDVQVLFVSVDPERDTPEKLAGYLGLFNPNFIGLTGTLAEIEAVASRFGIFFAKHDYEGAAGYLVDHTSTVLVHALPLRRARGADGRGSAWDCSVVYSKARRHDAVATKVLLRAPLFLSVFVFFELS